jgi:hypothetical protein
MGQTAKEKAYSIFADFYSNLTGEPFEMDDLDHKRKWKPYAQSAAILHVKMLMGSVELEELSYMEYGSYSYWQQVEVELTKL